MKSNVDPLLEALAAVGGLSEADRARLCDLAKQLAPPPTRPARPAPPPPTWVEKQLAPAVPTQGPAKPRIAFVGLHPSAIDVVRGEPLCGQDGRLFCDAYLEPLGLSKADVMLTHVAPVAQATAAQLADWQGWAQQELAKHASGLIVVALGKQAREQLGARADLVLPHPSCLRTGRDSAEVMRKVKRLQDRLAKIDSAPEMRVNIVRKIDDAGPEKQIAIGAVLDPYCVDSQDDWCPPWEVEQTAHDYLQNSRVVGVQHAGDADASVVESWLWPYPSDADYQAAMQNQPHKVLADSYGTTQVHSGTWMLGVKVNDPDLWDKVKGGQMTGFSIGGSGIRTQSQADVAMPNVQFIAR